MKLTLTLVGERVKPSPYYSSSSNTEEYDHVRVEALVGDSAVIANTLRAIADDIAPRPVVQSQPVVNFSGGDFAKGVADALRRYDAERGI